MTDISPVTNTYADSNGTYRFDPSLVRAGLVAGVGGLLLFVGLVIVLGRNGPFGSVELVGSTVIILGLIGCIAQSVRLYGRVVQIDDGGISMRDRRGKEIGGLRWVELARVSERRRMAQLALWDWTGTRRVLVDQQFENFGVIRSRILAQYAKVFTLESLPIEFRSPDWFLPESFVLVLGALLLGWATWSEFRQDQRLLSTILLGFLIGVLLSLLNLHPRLRGPSVLFEDRIVLRSFFKTEEIHKNNVAGVEMEDVANPRSGIKFSFITLKAIDGNQLKITSQYGSIPEIYLTLRAWLGQHRRRLD